MGLSVCFLDCRFRPGTRGAAGTWGCGMRWILITALLPIMAIPSWAAKRMTVAQLEQMLSTEKAAHKSDIEIARKISDVELSERLTDLALGELSKKFAGGSQPAMALLLLADRSSFLDPPAKELPATPAPDAATPPLPRALAEALDAMEASTAVQSWFSPTFLEAYLRHKRAELATLTDLDPDELCDRYAEIY